jgi:hypothetical protein
MGFAFLLYFVGYLVDLNGCQISKKVSSTLKSASITASDKKKERQEKFKDKNERRYDWLLDIKDEQGKRVGDPDYDSRTLYIPKTAWKEFTPFERQFWEIKSKHWDKVVFFKKGKFYGRRLNMLPHATEILICNEKNCTRMMRQSDIRNSISN